MKLRKGVSSIELPPHHEIVQVRATEKGDRPYLLVKMQWFEIERMRKQDPVPYKKPTFYAVKNGCIELMSETRMPMEIIVRYLPPPKEV